MLSFQTCIFFQTVQTLMKCHIMQQFIWVYNVCQNTRLEVSGTKLECLIKNTDPIDVHHLMVR